MKDLRSILNEFTKYRKEQIQCFIFSFINIGLSLIFPYVLKGIFDYGVLARNRNVLIKLSLIAIVILIAQNVFNFYSNRFNKKIKVKYVIDTRRELHTNLKYLKGEVLNMYSTGTLTNIIINDVEQIASSFITIIFDLIKNLLISFGTIVILLRLNAKLTFVVIIIQLILILISNYLSEQSKIKTVEFIDLKDTRQQSFFEYMNDLENIICAGECDFHSSILNEAEKVLQNKFLELSNFGLLNSLSGNILNTLSQIIACFLGGLMILSNSFTLGDLIAFITYTSYLIKPMYILSELNYEIKTSIIGIGRLNKLKNYLNRKSKQKIEYIKSIDFKNVNFSYGDKNILNDLTMKFESGKSYAIIGENGSGKSTIIKLILKLWDVIYGNIYINDIDIYNLDEESIREKISIVPQNIILPSVSIKSYLFSSKHLINEDEMMKYLEIVDMKAKVLASKKGFNSIINKDISFSGGEKQRIRIAKALIKESQVLILDEFTSNLDEIIENEIIESIMEENINILIVITHESKILENMDKVYNL